MVEILLSALISASHEELSKLIGMLGMVIKLSYLSSFAALMGVIFFSSVPLLLGSFCANSAKDRTE